MRIANILIFALIIYFSSEKSEALTLKKLNKKIKVLTEEVKEQAEEQALINEEHEEFLEDLQEQIWFYHPNTTESPETEENLLITNGFHNGNYLISTTLLNFDNFVNFSVPVKGVFNTLGEMGMGGLVQGVPIYCGGIYGQCLNTCFKAGELLPFSTMSAGRFEASSTVINDTLFVIGGVDRDSCSGTPSTTSEFISLESETTTPGPDLSFSYTYGCAVTLSSTEVMIIGGNHGSEKSAQTLIYDIASKQWTDGPSLIYARVSIGCASIGNLIITTGGGGLSSVLSTTETLEYSTTAGMQWVERASLPYAKGVYGHKNVPNGDKSGFLTLGGIAAIDGSFYSNWILELICSNENCDSEWTLKGFFDTPRYRFVAFWIPSNFDNDSHSHSFDNATTT